MTGDRRITIKNAESSAYSYERTLLTGGSPAEATAKVAAWRESAFMSEELFRDRLARSGMTEETFGALITGGTFTAAPEAVAWAGELTAILEAAGADAEVPDVETSLFGYVFPRLPFGSLIGRFLTHYEARLAEGLSDGPEVLRHLAGSVRRQFSAALADRLLRVCARTLIVELNGARVDGKLEGATPEERYEDYDRRLLADPDYLELFFAAYPVLGRSMVECGRQWTAYVTEVLRRLVADEEILRTAGLVNGPVGRLADIALDLGDGHNRGRSVAMLTFEDGERVVYKPRSVAAEAVYSALAETVNGYGPRFHNMNMKVVERDDYGWCEFIAHEPCSSPEEIKAFYWRIGGTLANLLHLGAIDFHMENIIAAGAYPVPIDLETIFQHPPFDGEAVTAHQQAMRRLFQGVLATGILPARVFGDRRVGGVDLSAINGGASTETSKAVPTIVDAYQDTMRIEARTAEMGQAKNRPYADGVEVRPEDHMDEVIAGFSETYEIIEKNAPVFAAMLNASADVEIRHLARQTRRYGLFLTESFHPRYLRNALDREQLLDKLWATVETRPDLAPLVESEKRQLINGDIPCFRTQPGATGIHAPGYDAVDDFFAAPSLVEMREKLAGFSPEHRRAQEQIVRETMSTLLTNGGRERHRPVPGSGRYDPAAAAALARQLASKLADQAILGADDCSWLGVSVDGGQEDALTYRPVGTALYDGLAGLAVMYAHAGGLFGDERFADLARRSTVPVLDHLRDARENGLADTTGAFSGIAGLLYALDQMAAVTGDSRYADHIEQALPLLLRVAQEETSPDVIGGLAGGAIVAMNLHRQYGSPQLREIAALCARRLQETSIDVEGAAGWKPAPNSPPLGGFSHGSAGIGWVLFELASFLGDGELRELGRRAVDFDRRLFVPGEGRWRDLRLEQGAISRAPEPAGWWCNGGAGIGLSRLLIARVDDDPELLTEAEAALSAVYDGGFGQNHSLCHGDFGNLALLTLAAETLPDAGRAAHWAGARDRFAHGVISQIQSSGAISGIPAGRIDVPGMMIGTAGICLGLMRLAEPGRVPDVLSLQARATAS